MSAIPPQVLVIVGAQGDLSWRKLHPALNRVLAPGSGNEGVRLVGVDARFAAVHDYGTFIAHRLEQPFMLGDRILGSASGIRESAGGAPSLQTLAASWPVETRLLPRLYYLAVPADIVADVTDEIAALERQLGSGGVSWPGNAAVVIEKPFGHDLDSARDLNRRLGKAGYAEERVFRADHYLAKEMVRDLLHLRFANAVFAPIWNREHIDHIQISVTETLGVEERGRFYDRTGCLRDMVQCHLLQILALIAMECPDTLDPDDIREEKVELIRSLRLDGGNSNPTAIARSLVTGQYNQGQCVVRGSLMRVGSYQQDLLDVTFAGDRTQMSDFLNGRLTSNTETFAALKVFVKNSRWRGVPFFLRTGKRVGTCKCSEVAVYLRETRQTQLFGRRPNVIVVRIEPDEGLSIRLCLAAGRDGAICDETVLHLDRRAAGGSVVEPYERLLTAALRRDSTLFVRGDEVEAAWAFMDPLIRFAAGRIPETYPAGSWGPATAMRLLEESDSSGSRHWHQP